MNIDLSQHTILITGGLGAISEYILKGLHACGARMVVTDIRPEGEAREVLKQWGLADQFYHTLDVMDREAFKAQMAAVLEEHPEVTIALGHAGGTIITSFADCAEEDFESVVNFNLMGQTRFAREILRHWTARCVPGHLIFTSSYVSRIPMAGITAYTMSKAGLEMFAKNLALEYAPQGIRVNAVAPGNVAAGSSDLLYDTDPVYREWVDRVSPLGKRNSPEAIANAFIYLCSNLGDEMDGHVLQVDQGVGLPKLG